MAPRSYSLDHIPAISPKDGSKAGGEQAGIFHSNRNLVHVSSFNLLSLFSLLQQENESVQGHTASECWHRIKDSTCLSPKPSDLPLHRTDQVDYANSAGPHPRLLGSGMPRTRRGGTLGNTSRDPVPKCVLPVPGWGPCWLRDPNTPIPETPIPQWERCRTREHTMPGRSRGLPPEVPTPELHAQASCRQRISTAYLKVHARDTGCEAHSTCISLAGRWRASLHPPGGD